MKVSVVMPVYNGARYLQEAIDSILKQTFSDLELIIVDDGSTDDSGTIIQMNADLDKRIVPLRNEKNSGICVTLNKGIDAARGEYIARMDCDDVSEPNRLAVQVAFMDSRPEYGLVGTKIRIFGEGIANPFIFEFDDDWRMCVADMIYASCMAHPSIIMRTNILRKYSLYYIDEFRGMEDFYMWWQFAKHSKITNIQQPLLNYRQHIKQVTKKGYDEKHMDKGRKFLNERLEFLHIHLSESQKELMLKYIYGGSLYTDIQMVDFIGLSNKIISDIKNSRPELESATRLVMAKAISMSINISKNSNMLFKSKAYYTRKAFFSGCMPFMWFAKSRLHQIIGR